MANPATGMWPELVAWVSTSSCVRPRVEHRRGVTKCTLQHLEAPQNAQTRACDGRATHPMGWICIWKVGHLAPDTVRDWIERALGVRGPTIIQKLRRSRQRHGFRYDLFVKPEAVPRVLDCLRRQEHLAGWHVREHVPFATRARRRSPKALASKQRVFASWNIHGTKGKRQELTWFLQREQVGVLALQETLHKSDSWRLRLGNYQVLSSPMSEGKVGERGVALAISPSLTAHDTGTRSPFWIWARILHPSFPQGLIVGSVYVIGHEGKERRAMLRGLRDSIRDILRRHAGSPIMVMGDWNMDAPMLDATLAEWSVPLRRLRCRGSPRSRWRGAGALRDLDHIVVSADLQSQLANAWVNRSWDLSDHWPVCTFPLSGTRLESSPFQTQGGVGRFKRELIKASVPAIACHNRWQALAEEDEAGPEACVERFLETSWLVAKATGVAPSPGSQRQYLKPARPPLSRKCRRLVEARRKVFAKWVQAPSGEEKEALWVTYSELRKGSRKLIRDEQRASWARFLAGGMELMVSGEWKRAWRWIKSLSQRSAARSLVPQPVRDLDGNLQVEPGEIAKAWAAHYAALAQDVTHHSRDPAHWQEMGTPLEVIGDIDEPISWRELNAAIRGIRAGKAPGLDGLPPEWFKAMAEHPCEAGSEPSTPMGKAFFKAIQGV